MALTPSEYDALLPHGEARHPAPRNLEFCGEPAVVVYGEPLWYLTGDIDAVCCNT